MKHIHHYIIVPTLVAISSLATPYTGQAAVLDTEVDGPVLPEIWVKAGPRVRLKATKAAELDADRLLAERIYGLQVDAETTLRDLVEHNDSLSGAVSATLVGSITTRPPEYLDDGRVRVVRAVKIREVIDTLNRVIKGKRLDDGSFSATSDEVKTDRKTNDKIIDVMGNSAIPGSEGHQKILAKRAAEMDAYRELAKRVMGMKIDSETTIRDQAVSNDEILASLSQVIKAATPTAIKYNKSDGSCEVTMELKIRDIIRTLKRKSVGSTAKTTLMDEESERTFSATGVGRMPEIEEESDEAPSGESDEQFELILKEVVQTGPVIQ
jgi:hypothetical protein